MQEWHNRVHLFEGDAHQQIQTYTEGVKTVDPNQAVGKPHTLWCAFAHFYERHGDLGNARAVFDKATQVRPLSLKLGKLFVALESDTLQYTPWLYAMMRARCLLIQTLLQAPFAYVDDLSHVWCQWAEMELKHHNYRRAMQVLTRAVQEPDVTVAPKRMTADEHKVCAAVEDLAPFVFYVVLRA